ncbi:hypothetical protein [Cellulomonas sp. URHB0016]
MALGLLIWLAGATFCTWFSLQTLTGGWLDTWDCTIGAPNGNGPASLFWGTAFALVPLLFGGMGVLLFRFVPPMVTRHRFWVACGFFVIVAGLIAAATAWLFPEFWVTSSNGTSCSLLQIGESLD